MLTMKGVYKLLMNSSKPIAEKFQDWLVDVIEEIRKTGQYRTDERTLHIYTITIYITSLTL
jgi:prophage antirepressor-like protein